jgi:hypothetical protein
MIDPAATKGDLFGRSNEPISEETLVSKEPRG